MVMLRPKNAQKHIRLTSNRLRVAALFVYFIQRICAYNRIVRDVFPEMPNKSAHMTGTPSRFSRRIVIIPQKAPPNFVGLLPEDTPTHASTLSNITLESA
jgi:hypothetical protein